VEKIAVRRGSDRPKDAGRCGIHLRLHQELKGPD
jgi:hypothetical protein